MKRSPSLTVFVLILLFLFGVLPLHVRADEPVYSFAVVPQHAASKIARTWTPVLDWLSTRSGYRLRVATARNIPEFERRLSMGQYDFSYMNPYHFTVFNEEPGYRALARQKNKQIQGVIVVRKDSPIERLAELDGEQLAFPSPAAFAASILPRGHLHQQAIGFTPLYVSSHDSVYMAVANGVAVAGGGVIRTLNNMPEAVREQLRVLWHSDGYTPHAVAVHPRVPADVVTAVQQAMLEMAEEPEAMQLLEALSFNQGFITADNEDWDDVRALDVNAPHTVHGVE